MKEHNTNQGRHQGKSDQFKVGGVKRVAMLRRRLIGSIGLPFANILPWMKKPRDDYRKSYQAT